MIYSPSTITSQITGGKKAERRRNGDFCRPSEFALLDEPTLK